MVEGSALPEPPRWRLWLTAGAALALSIAAGLPTGIMIYSEMASELAPLLAFLAAGVGLLAGVLILSRLRHCLPLGARWAVSLLLSAAWVGAGGATTGEPTPAALILLQILLFTWVILFGAAWFAPKQGGALGSKHG